MEEMEEMAEGKTTEMIMRMIKINLNLNRTTRVAQKARIKTKRSIHKTWERVLEVSLKPRINHQNPNQKELKDHHDSLQ